MTYRPDPHIMMPLESAAALLKKGRYLQAQLICNELLQRKPDDVNVLHMAGLTAAELKEYAKAEEYLQKATKIAPEFAQAFYNLGNLHLKTGLLKKAIDCLTKSIELDKTFLPAYEATGEAYFKMNLLDEALIFYQKALAFKEDTALLCRIAKAYSSLGDFTKAEESLRRAIAINSDCAAAYYALSRISQTKFTEQEVSAMESSLEKEHSPDDNISLNYSLYKGCVDIGDTDRSFHYLHEASLLKRKMVKYSAEKNRLLTDRLIATFTPEFFQERSSFGHDDDAPIFILSMPRAGSTLTEQIVSSHSQVFGAGELPNVIMVAQSSVSLRNEGGDFVERIPHFTQNDSVKLGQFYIDLCKKWRLEDTPFFTDKLTVNFSLVGFIALMLPKAKMIHVHRDPMDNCFGCYKVNFAGDLNFAYDLTELGEYYCDYWRLMEHWNTVLPGKIYNLSYENLVHNQEAETRKLIDYCGLAWEEQCLRFYETERLVKTASAQQVRKPISSDSIGQWKVYEKHLQPLIKALAPVLK